MELQHIHMVHFKVYKSEMMIKLKDFKICDSEMMVKLKDIPIKLYYNKR